MKQFEGIQLAEDRNSVDKLVVPGLGWRRLDHDPCGSDAITQDVVLVEDMDVLDVQMEILHDGVNVAAAVAESVTAPAPSLELSWVALQSLSIQSGADRKI